MWVESCPKFIAGMPLNGARAILNTLGANRRLPARANGTTLNANIRPFHRNPTAILRTLQMALVLTVLASALSVAPATAFAAKYDSDRVGGVKLGSGTIDRAKAPDISAKSGVLVHGTRVLWARKADSERAMASTTKLMTALLILERGGLGKKVRITKTAARTPYATGLKAGERLTVRRLLELTLVCSSNDAATALAIHHSGSVKKFSSAMNRRAKQLGMVDTKLKNPHGLDAKGHYSSAQDLTLLMREAVKHPEFKRIIKMKSVTLPKYKKRGARTIRSTDKLLGQVKGLRGGKTGFTNDARFCFVASARRDGMTLTSVVLGAPSSYARFASSRRLLDWGFKYYKKRTLCTAGAAAATVAVTDGEQASVDGAFAKTKTARVLTPLGPVTSVPDLPPTVSAPVTAGQKLGVVRFVQGAQVIATVDVLAASTVETLTVEPEPQPAAEALAP